MRWEVKPLGEVCEIIGGGTPSRKVGAYYGGDIPWATVGDMNVEQLITTDLSITSVGLENSSSKVIPSGNVIIATRVGLGKSCILNVDTAINQDLKGLVPKGSIGLIPMFLFRWTQSIAPRIIGAGTGATVQGVKITFVSQLPIPIPPIAEQERIVAVLDEAFAAIDKAKANIERKLTNARELFQSRLNDIFSNPSEDWEVKPLGEVCGVLNGRAYKKTELLDQGRDLVLRVGNFFTNKKYFYSDLDLPEKNYCESGDLLYAWSASFGPRIWQGGRAVFHYHIWKMVPESTLTRDFLFWFLEWDVDQVKRAHGTGTTMIHVTKRDMEARKMFLPPLLDQASISDELFDWKSKLDVLETKYQTELDNLEELRQSILEQAFEGKLTEPVAA